MKPLRPLWITLTTIFGFLVLTVLSYVRYGAFALIPLAFAMAFVYDLSHHGKSKQVVIITRVAAIFGLMAIAVAAVVNKLITG